jgi:tRNA pseudouridine38-40 synthase
VTEYLSRSAGDREASSLPESTAADRDGSGLLHLQALVEYDGTDYYGFQVQATKPTIQGELEAALGTLTGEAVRIRYAGRTDTGVHALGQVITMSLRWRHSLADLQRAWNARLPHSIAVRELRTVKESRFHPRFSARSRVYQYTVWTAPWRSPLHQRFAHHEPRPLDVVAMNQAAGLLIGSHDFASFGQPPQGENTLREVYVARWQWSDTHLLRLEIEANAFLRRMVRTITGTLLEVGLGRRPVASIAELLARRDRGLAAPPVPACGLCLVAVKY